MEDRRMSEDGGGRKRLPESPVILENSLRGRRLKGKRKGALGKGALGKGVLGARGTRGRAREE